MKGSGIGVWSLLVLMTINVCGGAAFLLLKREVSKTRQPQAVEIDSSFPVFSGVDLGGKAWQAHAAPCRVIRITDDNCSFCKKDKPSYASFVEAARRASCEIVEIAPMAGKMAADARPGIVQLKYVDADIGAVLAPFATPHTVILDGAWKLKWTRRGIFDDQSLAGSLAVLDTLAARKLTVNR